MEVLTITTSSSAKTVFITEKTIHSIQTFRRNPFDGDSPYPFNDLFIRVRGHSNICDRPCSTHVLPSWFKSWDTCNLVLTSNFIMKCRFIFQVGGQLANKTCLFYGHFGIKSIPDPSWAKKFINQFLSSCV